jgi:quercetin dioxygenase-like cupin family protein
MPSVEQVKTMLAEEGFLPVSETLASKTAIASHRHPFDEIRTIVAGSLIMNISGNQILLRAGDRIEIPSNTRHSYSNESEEECVCVVAERPF